MRDLAVLFLHLLATVARLAGPGGARSVVAESVLVKQQVLILKFWRRARSLELDNRRWTFLLGRLYVFVLRTDGRMHPGTPWSAERQALANRVLAGPEDIE
jgi:hypothetical protein